MIFLLSLKIVWLYFQYKNTKKLWLVESSGHLSVNLSCTSVVFFDRMMVNCRQRCYAIRGQALVSCLPTHGHSPIRETIECNNRVQRIRTIFVWIANTKWQFWRSNTLNIETVTPSIRHAISWGKESWVVWKHIRSETSGIVWQCQQLIWTLILWRNLIENKYKIINGSCELDRTNFSLFPVISNRRSCTLLIKLIM